MISKPTTGMRRGAAELVIGDPHSQAGLIQRIPDRVGPTHILNFYHYHLWPHEKAHCAKCGARRHRDGYTVELEDGTLALVGSDCGAELWGERWETVSKTFHTELHEAGIILDVRDVLSELGSIRAALAETWGPAVNQLAAHRRRFNGMMRPVFEALKRGADGSDHALELDGHVAIQIEGWAYFAMEDATKQFQIALDEIDRAIDAGSGRATELGVRTVSIGAARDRLDAVARAVRGLRTFFTQDVQTFGRVVDIVGTLLRTERYRAGNQCIIDIEDQRTIGLPPDFPTINAEPLRRLRDLTP